MNGFFHRVSRKGLAAVVFALTVAVLGGGVAHGHAYMEESTPEAGAVVSEWPESVYLKFTEPVEVRSSMFKVYPLDAEGVDNPLQLNAKARALFEEVLPLRRDEADRVDAEVLADRATTDEIRIVLQEDVEPGVYVVMWRVLSIDTHVVSDYFVMTYDPSAN